MNRNQFLKVSSLAGVGLAINPLNSCGLNSKLIKLKSIGLGLFSVPKAIKFYERNGFQEFDKHIFKLGDDKQTDILMRLAL